AASRISSVRGESSAIDIIDDDRVIAHVGRTAVLERAAIDCDGACGITERGAGSEDELSAANPGGAAAVGIIAGDGQIAAANFENSDGSWMCGSVIRIGVGGGNVEAEIGAGV